MSSGDSTIDALLAGNGQTIAPYHQPGTPLTVSFQFLERQPADLAYGVSAFQPLTEPQREQIRGMLAAVSALAGVSFVEQQDGTAQLQYGLYGNTTNKGEVRFDFTFGARANVWLNHEVGEMADLSQGYGRFIALHETAHALGLKHPGQYGEWDQGPYLPNDLDRSEHTVVSYNNPAGFPASFGDFDALAFRYLYGPPLQEQDHSPTPPLNGTNVGTDFADLIELNDADLAGQPILHAHAGNDTLSILPGTPPERAWFSFDGGDGTDSLKLPVNRDQATLGAESAGQWRMLTYLDHGKMVGAYLYDVERILFNDSAIALDVAGEAAQVYRLYQAAFARQPDKAGLGYWIAQRDKGTSLNDIASAFIDGGEFTERYGLNPSNEAFLTGVYANVLGRSFDQAGYTYWLDELDRGITDRRELLVSFSESDENRLNAIEAIGQAIEYQPYLA